MKKKNPNGNEIEAVYRAFGCRVEMIRQTLGLTQDDLCKRVKLSRASIANIETGRQRILLDDVQKFADALGTTPKGMLKGIWF